MENIESTIKGDTTFKELQNHYKTLQNMVEKIVISIEIQTYKPSCKYQLNASKKIDKGKRIEILLKSILILHFCPTSCYIKKIQLPKRT